MAQCAPGLKKISLELGGNAPFIVFDDADLEEAVAGAITCKFRNSGQTCISANRMLVQEGIYDDFVAGFTEAVRALKVADGFAEGVNVGPLIDEPAIEKVERHVADALERGAEVLVGGERIEGQFFQPSVLVGVTAEMAMSCEETFGPVAGIARFATEEEAVRIANDTPYGLAAYFYSQGLGRVTRVAEALEYGIVGINTGPHLDRGRAVRRREGVGHRARGIVVRDRRVARAQVLGDRRDRRRVIRRAARLPRAHGKACRGAAALRGGGNPDPAGDPRRARRRVHDRDRRALDVHDALALRLVRRARGAARAAPGRRALEGVPREGAAALPHAAEPDPRPDRLLAAPVTARLDGKVAIVTGGAQGIGAAIAAGLAAEGAEVVIVDLEPPEGGIRADVSSEDDVSGMVGEALERNGRIDILVNNAGLYASLEMRAFTEIPLEEWNRVMEVNVASMFLTSRAVVPVMREQGGGKIVNISSGTPFRGVPFLLHYVTSKGAIVALTRALARARQGLDRRELRRARVHHVRRREVASRGDREAARRVGRLAHDPAGSGPRGRRRRGRLPLTPAADFITGQTMVIDGGQYFH